ncbi:MAG: hypothetical protein OXL36_08985 [Bryobacterales bacterium]|nr:hypothetical protein [Bryobacterales bacterium]MDE0293025.1 hypothetical protein [Bryobacterales bacterium]
MTFPHLDGRAGKLADALDLPADLAEWLAVTALHSGCFLRSQLQVYFGFAEENRRSPTRIIHKLINKQLITETSLKSLGLLARVTNKAIYRFIGADNIRHRRSASLPLTFRRLLALDYVLDHPHLPWLPTEEEKVACFDQLGIDRAKLPHRVWDNATGHTVRLFANKHPIAVDPRSKQACFVYADSEEKSPQGVLSWRSEHAALWSDLCRLGFRLSIVHASYNLRLEESVSRLFTRWTHQPHSTVSRAEAERELARVQQALRSDDRSELEVYGGFNGALRASAALEERLEEHDNLATYSADYSTWISERILQAVRNPNPSGSHIANA